MCIGDPTASITALCLHTQRFGKSQSLEGKGLHEIICTLSGDKVTWKPRPLHNEGINFLYFKNYLGALVLSELLDCSHCVVKELVASFHYGMHFWFMVLILVLHQGFSQFIHLPPSLLPTWGHWGVLWVYFYRHMGKWEKNVTWLRVKKNPSNGEYESQMWKQLVDFGLISTSHT